MRGTGEAGTERSFVHGSVTATAQPRAETAGVGTTGRECPKRRHFARGRPPAQGCGWPLQKWFVTALQAKGRKVASAQAQGGPAPAQARLSHDSEALRVPF